MSKMKFNPISGEMEPACSEPIKTTWRDLMDLRTRKLLEPGRQYRINYSASHNSGTVAVSGRAGFDLSLTAISEDSLSESAVALPTDGNHYYDANNLSAWKIKYCLDNDTSRFHWACNAGDAVCNNKKYTYSPADDKTVDGVYYYAFRFGEETLYSTKRNPAGDDKVYVHEDDYFHGMVMNEAGWWTTPNGGGKGVIYYMRDEFGNEAPYDFKSFAFEVSGDDADRYALTRGEYYFTFSHIADDGTVEDASLQGKCRGNVIGPSFLDGVQTMPRIIFANTDMLPNCVSNSVGADTSDIFFGGGCSNNTVGCGCTGIFIQGSCAYNKVGSQCSDITLGQGCERNMLSDRCESVTLGMLCLDNVFGSRGASITLGRQSSYNVFEKVVSAVVLGNNCMFNHYESYTSDIRFLKIDGTDLVPLNYCWNNRFVTGCMSVCITPATDAPSSGLKMQNIRTLSGVRGIANVACGKDSVFLYPSNDITASEIVSVSYEFFPHNT